MWWVLRSCFAKVWSSFEDVDLCLTSNAGESSGQPTWRKHRRPADLPQQHQSLLSRLRILELSPYCHWKQGSEAGVWTVGVRPATSLIWPPKHRSCEQTSRLGRQRYILTSAQQLTLPTLPQTRPGLVSPPVSMAWPSDVHPISLRSEQACHTAETTTGTMVYP